MTDDEVLAIAKELIEPKGFTDIRVRKSPILFTEEGLDTSDYRAVTARVEGIPGGYHCGFFDVSQIDEGVVRLGLGNWPTAEEARAKYAETAQ